PREARPASGLPPTSRASRSSFSPAALWEPCNPRACKMSREGRRMAEKRRSGGGVARLALILAILALAVAWAAYRREGGELKTLWRDLTRGAEGKVHITSDSDGDLRTWLAETQVRLERRRPEGAGGGEPPQSQGGGAQ